MVTLRFVMPGGNKVDVEFVASNAATALRWVGSSDYGWMPEKHGKQMVNLRHAVAAYDPDDPPERYSAPPAIPLPEWPSRS